MCDTFKTVFLVLGNIAWFAFKQLWSVYDIFFDVLVAIETVVGIKCGDHAQETNWHYVLGGVALFILAAFGLCFGIGELLMDWEELKEKLADTREFLEKNEDDGDGNIWKKGSMICLRVFLEDIPSLIITCALRKSVATTVQTYSIIASMGMIIGAVVFTNCAI